MRIALISDVHANLPALEAVLDDAKARGAEAVWNLGDFVGYGAFPDEVVRRLREEADESIIGNYDRKVLRFPRRRDKWRTAKKPDKFDAFQWAYEHLSPDSLRHLASLEQELRMEVFGRRVLLTHGSPASEEEPITDETPESRLAELAELAAADVVLCGHSHRPVRREVGGVLFVGAGSVGRPEGDDARACYAMMEILPEGLAVEHHRVEYAQPVGDEPLDAAAEEQALAAVRDLGERCDVEQGHTQQVTKLALRLFDELAAAHGLGRQERFHLRCGALLHDIGWVNGQQSHHKTAMRLILADEQLPFDERARQIVALVARYHRKAVPKPKHGHFAALGAADRQLVRVLGGILRVADGLDRSHMDIVTDVRCEVSADRILIRCVARAPAGAELWAAQEKADLLVEAMGLPVTFEAI
ncbi:MAG: metallophosphoesterase family protein [Phycisphaerae bacterium]